MRAVLISVAVACAIVVSAEMPASPGQTTQQPGQMTQGHVQIDNRGRAEAIPVELSEVNLDTPLRVQVVNSEPADPMQVRQVRLLWDYQAVTVPPGEDLASRLNPLGASGWETTGVAFVKGEGTTVLLKRARQP